VPPVAALPLNMCHNHIPCSPPTLQPLVHSLPHIFSLLSQAECKLFLHDPKIRVLCVKFLLQGNHWIMVVQHPNIMIFYWMLVRVREQVVIFEHLLALIVSPGVKD
jgi:hypothetical protein